MSGGRYEGVARIHPARNGRYRVWMRGPNFEGEVTISARQAKTILNELAFYLAPAERSPGRASTAPKGGSE